jgi:hypothetical protein
MSDSNDTSLTRRAFLRVAGLGAAGIAAISRLTGRASAGGPKRVAVERKTEGSGTPAAIPLADRKAAAHREIEGYEKQARFHIGAIREISRLVPDAKGNVEAIARCAYLASVFGYHTQPLIQIAQLAAECDHECPELAPIAELAVLTLSGTGDVVRLAQEAAAAQTDGEKSRVREAIERMRARASCATIEEALQRQSRRYPSLAQPRAR